jgi:hypothetical protein
MNRICTRPSGSVHAPTAKSSLGNDASSSIRGIVMKSLILGLAAAASLAAALPAAAQPVDQREHHQAVRIEQGVRSGALTPRETLRL